MYRLNRRLNLLNVRMQSSTIRVSSLLNNKTLSDHHHDHQSLLNKFAVVSSLLLGAGAARLYESFANHSSSLDFETDADDGMTNFINFSGTHAAMTSLYFEPSSAPEIESFIRQCHEQNQAVRPVGSGLSPNGIGFSNVGMVNMVHCNDIIQIDRDSKQVTVSAGCTVQELLDGIRPYGLTLENIASITQQQIGGFLQVGAHGTGATIPPCDMQIVQMKIATPQFGMLTLSESENPDLFHLARVGLGAFGVVTEVTIQCVPIHTLHETTFVLSHEEAEMRRDELVNTHRHVRFMWIPFTDRVVVVASDPTDPSLFAKENDLNSSDRRLPTKCDDVGKIVNDMSEEDRLLPLSNLVRQVYMENGLTASQADSTMTGLSFAGIRDVLLAAPPGPLDTAHVRRINEAEAEYWANSTGNRVAYSDGVLAFDCGGQQWVYEVCFPTGYVGEEYGGGDGRDVAFVRELLEMIEEQDIPAPSPIEQRWTGRSTSKLSPAFSENENEVFTWVGIIMYMPTQDPRMRQHVTNEFRAYSEVLNQLCDRYGAVGHWAKIETELLSRDERLKLQERLSRRYEYVEEWKQAQRQVDPKGIMLNDVVMDCLDISSV